MSQQQESKKIIIFIGPPGSGKGSISGLCVKKYNWKQLSTGNLCRKHIADQTEIGKAIDFAMKSGRLVSDDLIVQMVEEYLAYSLEKASVIILDGYPRTLNQAQKFIDTFRRNFKDTQLKIIRFRISDDTIVKRLSSRYVCKNKECQAVYSANEKSARKPQKDGFCDECSQPLYRRDDDQPEAVMNRLQTYHMFEGDLIKYFEQMDQNIIHLSVEKSLEEVFKEFEKYVEA